MKKILLVSWYYYPATAVGARRIFNFKKYLARFGHEVRVLSAEKRYYADIDPGLGGAAGAEGVERARPRFYVTVPRRETGEGICRGTVRRARFILWREMSKVLFPDPFAGWITPAIRRAERMHQDCPFDVVLSSGAPWSSFIVGDKIASHHRLPHLMDYRDPWTVHEHSFAYARTSRGAKPFRARSEALERELLNRAAQVIVSTDDTARLFTRKFGGVVQDKLLRVRNGFDPDMYDFIKQRGADLNADPADGKFRLVHTGMYYASRRLNTFIEAVNYLVEQEGVTAANFEMRSFGPLHAEDRRLLKRHRLDAIFLESDFVAYEESLLALTRSSMNLLVIGPEHSAQIPAKLYDYLMVERPIFAIGPMKSETRKIIETHRYGVYADVTDPADIAQKLRRAMVAFRNEDKGAELCAPEDFNIRHQVYKLSQAISRL